MFFGVRSYRDNVAGGAVTFGRAFAVGFLITLISFSLHVITWEFIYFKLAPDFADKYAAYAIERARASGASAEQIAATTREMAFTEPFPIGLAVTLISAAVLRRPRVPPAASLN